MADLGNLHARLRLQCKRCQWLPPESTRMEAVQLHFQVDHDTSNVALDLVPSCTCGASMEHTHSRPTGGGRKDYWRCPGCENTGFIRREDLPPAKDEA